MINRESILSRTHYGTNIYSHILRQFYPGESVMYIVGRDCGICRNPFNNGDATLHIWMEKIHPEQKLSEEISRHHDSSGTIPDGDCFDFAQLYWNKAGQDLLNTINEELYLHLEEGYNPYGQKSKAAETERPIRRILFSFFKAPITNTQPYKNITLFDAYNYITGEYALKRTSTLRSFNDSKRARNYKAAHFDYCTFSGTFTVRNDKALVEHSGLLCLDFDHLQNVESLFDKLLEDQYFDTQLLFRSPSGDGLKWIVPINTAEMPHQDYFRAVANYVRATYGIEVDKSGKDISRACFLPFDSKAYINPNLK